MSADPSNTLVAVTGGSGYISAHIISQLLAKGYRVRAIVRDLSNQDKIAHLKKFPQKDGQLEYASAEISTGYGEVLKGAQILIHTATPFFYTAPDPQRDIVDPAVKGTRDAIEAAIASGVKRVVVTSSGGAFMSLPVTVEGTRFTEKDWNETSSLTNNPYFYSKRLAEEAAWALWNEKKDLFELVVVNPLFVVGPTLSTNINASLDRVKSYIMNDGKYPVAPGRVGIVDVRDVATAHVLAATHPDAVGKRLFASSAVYSWAEVPDAIKKNFPNYDVASLEGHNAGPNWTIDTSNLEKLGFEKFIPLEQSVKDSIESFIQLGLIPDKR